MFVGLPRPWASFQTTRYGLQRAKYGVQTARYGLHTIRYGLQTPRGGLQPIEGGLQTVYGSLQTIDGNGSSHGIVLPMTTPIPAAPMSPMTDPSLMRGLFSSAM